MKKLLRLISVATMLLAATTFMACSSDDDDDSSGARSVSARTSGSIVGVVLDNKGEPVEGATVTLGSKTATTNYGGQFEITGVSPNDTALMKAAVNYTSTTEALAKGTGDVDGVKETKTGADGETTKVGTSESGASAAYKLTATKKGYLSAVVTGIYVTYKNTENPSDSRKNALLHGLQYDYQGILDKYAEAVGKASAAVGTTATTTTTATEDTTATTTVQTGSDADRVFKDVSEALKGLEEKYGADYYTEYFSDFATAVMVKCDASLKGKIKLNLKTKTGTTYDEKTYTPTSKPKVHASTVGKKYGDIDAADYTWETTADENGVFEFKECLPTGVAISITVDSFEEKITKEGATEAEAYWFSSASQVIYAQGTDSSTTKVTTTTTESTTTSKTTETTETDVGLTGITLGSKDANEKSYLIMLFAQNDKVWVTKTNVEDKSTGVLLTKNDALTFTFNKAMKKVEATGIGFGNLAKDAYTATFSEDKKTVTFTPNIGYWILSGDAQTIVLTVEAEDGATILLKNDFKAYFDNKVWVSVKDLSYKDYNDYRKLSDPITLVFSKPMNEKIAVKLDGNTTHYEEKWNDGDEKTELTLTPDSKVGYWDIGSKTSIDITIEDSFANSKDSYINTFAFWKVGASDDNKKVTVYFDNFNDVTLTKVSDSEFTVTFAKALKTLTDGELDKNVKVYKLDAFATPYEFSSATALKDRKVSINAEGTVLTIKALNGDFENFGYYAIDFGKDVFVALTGESILRKATTIDSTEVDANDKREGSLAKTPFVTTFTLGSEFKYTNVEVVEAKDVPGTAKASRLAYEDNDKYVKISFNKAVKTSAITIRGKVDNNALAGTTASPINYIDGKDVYLSLSGLKNNDKVILTGKVYSTSGDTWKLGTDTLGFDTGYVVSEKYFKMEASSLYDPKPSIAGGENDVKTQKVIPVEGNTFTFTFDQDVSKATWTAELYDEANVGKKDLEKTVYAVDVAADNDTVTVTVNKDKKQLDFSKKYYLSLKATNGVAGEEAFVYYDSNKTEVKDTYYKIVDASASTDANKTLGGKITKADNTVNGGKRYIVFETVAKDYQVENLYILAAHNGYDNKKTSQTTSKEEFAKSIQSDIVLEFNSDISKIINKDNVFLVKESIANTTKKADLDKKKTYASTAAVAGNVLTVTPTYAFPSESAVYVVVFDENGDFINLKDVAGAQYFASAYTSAIIKKTATTSTPEVDNTDKVLNEAKAATATTLKLAAYKADPAKKIANGQTVVFTFDHVIAEKASESSVQFGTYKLYHKKQTLPASASKWAELGTYTVGGTGESAIKYTKVTTRKEGDKTITEYNYPNANSGDLSIRKKQACIEAKLDANEFDYNQEAEFRLVCAIDNVEIYSETLKVAANNVVVVGDGKLSTLNPTGVTIPTAADTEETLTTAVGGVTFNVNVGSYLASVTNVEGAFGEGTSTAVKNPNNRVTNNKVTAELDETVTGEYAGKTIKVTIPQNETACKGDKLKITVVDVVGTTGTVEVILE